MLLVDDQQFVAVALDRLLASEQDIQLHCCCHGVDAVVRANAIGPAVILQDLVLPDIDGLTLIGMFRANPQTAGTPIIVLSGNDDAVTRARALSGGADDYLVKLPARNDLVACIRRHAAAGPLKSEVMAVSAGATTASGQDVNETLDGRVIAELRRSIRPDDADFTLMLIDEFIREAASLLERLRDARRRQDLQAVKAALHSLRGSSMTMGARRLATLCAQMEDHADRHPSGVVMSALTAELDREFSKVRAALANERQSSSQP